MHLTRREFFTMCLTRTNYKYVSDSEKRNVAYPWNSITFVHVERCPTTITNQHGKKTVTVLPGIRNGTARYFRHGRNGQHKIGDTSTSHLRVDTAKGHLLQHRLRVDTAKGHLPQYGCRQGASDPTLSKANSSTCIG